MEHEQTVLNDLVCHEIQHVLKVSTVRYQTNFFFHTRVQYDLLLLLNSLPTSAVC